MAPDVDTFAETDLNGVFERALNVNPFLDNRVNGPSKDGADVEGIHQAAFEQLTGLATEALATKRGIGAMLWGEAGVGKSHLLARLARWSAADRATFVYLHNLQAAPDQLPRSLLRAVVAALTRGRASGYYGTPLSKLVHAGLIEAIRPNLGRHPWDYLQRAWNAFVDRLPDEHPGQAGADRHAYEVLFRFYYSAYRVRNPYADGSRREDGAVARQAVQWLSGAALEPDEARSLGLPPAVPRDEPVALADAEQIKHVLVALARLAAAGRQPFVLAFDQVDNLDTDQASALARFLEAVIDAAPNLLVVTAGVRATLFHWRQTGVIQHSSWDRLAQFEVALQRVNGTEAGALVRARLEDFFRPYEALGGLRQRRQHDEYFPLGRSWYARQLRDKTDLRPRDVISLAREAWRGEQERLRSAGVGAWLNDEPAIAVAATELSAIIEDDREPSPEVLDRVLDDRIAQLCMPQSPPAPQSGDDDDLAELLRTVLVQCRDAGHRYGVTDVERVRPVPQNARPLYDFSVVLRPTPDARPTRVGVLVIAATHATTVATALRHLTEELPLVDRFVLVTLEWIGLPLGAAGKSYLSMIQSHFGDRFQDVELSHKEYLYLDALRETAKQARSNDLEIEIAPGKGNYVGEDAVIASHHRRDRYRGSRVLRRLLGTPAVPEVETLAAISSAGQP